MRPIRYLLVVTMVATALCADEKALVAGRDARLSRDTSTSQGPIVQRLSASFRRVVPAVRFIAVRLSFAWTSQDPAAREVEQALPLKLQLSPFDYRLPPPNA